MDQRPQRQRAVGGAAGDDNIRAGSESGGDREGADIGIGGDDLGRHRRTALHFLHTLGAQLFDHAVDIVANDGRDLQLDALFGEHLLDRVATGQRVHAASIANDLDAARRDFLGVRGDELRDEVGRVAQGRVLRLGAGQQRHGDLGQVIHHQVIDLAGIDQLPRTLWRIAPKAGRATQTDNLLAHHKVLISQ